MESEWVVSAIGFASRDSMTSVTRSMIILLGCELALSIGTYDYPIPHITCYSHVHSRLLGIYSMRVSLLSVAVNDSVYWKMVLSTRMMSLRYQKPFNPISIGVPYPFTAISHE